MDWNQMHDCNCNGHGRKDHDGRSRRRRGHDLCADCRHDWDRKWMNDDCGCKSRRRHDDCDGRRHW